MQNNPPESNKGSILQNLFGIEPPQSDPNQPYDNDQYYDDSQGPYDPNQPYDDGQYYDDGQGLYDPNQPVNNQFGPVQPNQYNQSLDPPIANQQSSRVYVEGVKARFRDMSIGAKIAVIIASVIPVALIVGLVTLVSSASKALINAQNDTQRRNDYSELAYKITNYMIENNGALPPNGSLDASIFSTKDPSGDPYKITVIECPSNGICPGSPKLTKGQVYVVKKAKCQDRSLTSTESSRTFAIWGYIENSNLIYCNSSS